MVDRDSGRVLVDSIEIHTVELAKYNGGQGIYAVRVFWNSGPIGLRTRVNIQKGSCETYLPGLEFLRATGELNAIREMKEEKQMCDAREKASLDIQSNLIDARQEGVEIGDQRGDQRGKLKASIQT